MDRRHGPLGRQRLRGEPWSGRCASLPHRRLQQLLFLGLDRRRRQCGLHRFWSQELLCLWVGALQTTPQLGASRPQYRCLRLHPCGTFAWSTAFQVRRSTGQQSLRRLRLLRSFCRRRAIHHKPSLRLQIRSCLSVGRELEHA